MSRPPTDTEVPARDDLRRRRRPAARPTAGGWPWWPATRTPTAFRVVYIFLRAADQRVELVAAGAPRRPVDPHPGRAVLPRRAGSSARSATCTASARTATRCRTGWSGTRTGPAAGTRCAATPTPPPRSTPTSDSFPFLEVEGDGVVRDPRRPDPRRAHRAGALPVLRRRGDHPADEGPAVVPAPRRREALRGHDARRRHRAGRTDQRRHRRRAHAWRSSWPSRTPPASTSTERPRRSARLLLELERLHNHVADLGALANDVGFGIAHAHTQPAARDAAAAQQGHDRAPAAARRHHHRRRPAAARCPTSTRSATSPREVAEIVDITLGPLRRRRPVHRHRRAERRAGRRSSARSATSPEPPASTSTPAATTRSLTSAPTFDAVVETGRRRAGPLPRPRPRGRRLRQRWPRPGSRAGARDQPRDRSRHDRGGPVRARRRRGLARHPRATASRSTPTGG